MSDDKAVLSWRASEALFRLNITVEELRRADEIYISLPGVGKKTLSEIRKLTRGKQCVTPS